MNQKDAAMRFVLQASPGDLAEFDLPSSKALQDVRARAYEANASRHAGFRTIRMGRRLLIKRRN